MKKHNQELEIDEDLALEHRTWKIQRIVWVILFLIVVAAVLGFTGHGGLLEFTEKTKSSPTQRMELEYDKYLRRQVASELKVNLQQQQSSNPSIFFSSDFYRKQRVEQVVPEPEKVQVGPEGITYTFNTEKEPSQIIFYIKPMQAGRLSYTAQASDGGTVTVTQFIYP